MELSTLILMLTLFWFDCFLGSSGIDCTKTNKADIQLIDSIEGINDRIGIVEVCRTGPPYEWNVVCADDGLTVEGASHAVCRQKGYVGANDFHTVEVTDSIIETISPASKAIKTVKCPIVRDYYADGELVLMRCEHSDTLIDIHNCSHILGVQCEETDIHSSYPGQVWLNNDGTSKPLMLYLNIGGTAESGYVCISKQLYKTNQLQLLADTVCRQLGYTNSQRIINSTKKYEHHVHYQINGDINCGCTCPSLNCLVDCIDVITISKASECGSGYTSIEIACEYDQAIAGEYGAGSRGVCMTHNHSDELALILGTVLGAFVVLLFVSSLVLGCLLRHEKKKHAYQPIGGEARWYACGAHCLLCCIGCYGPQGDDDGDGNGGGGAGGGVAGGGGANDHELAERDP